MPSLRHIAEETVAALERGNYTTSDGNIIDFSVSLRQCISETHCFDPESLATIREAVLAQPSIADHTEFELVNETTLEGSARIVKSGQYQHVAALIFASAKHPGGGFLGGAKAQE